MASARQPTGADDVPGEPHVAIDGVIYQRGDKIRLKPGTERDLYDKMLDGRIATIERVYLDYDDKIYVGVTVDDDPGQDVMRESGRYLFFFTHELAAP